MTRILTLALVTLALTLSSAASAQEAEYPAEAKIVLSRSYVAACEANLEALEEAGRWLDVTEGQLKECRTAREAALTRNEALVRENEGLKRDAPSRWRWFAAGAGASSVLFVALLLIAR